MAARQPCEVDEISERGHFPGKEENWESAPRQKKHAPSDKRTVTSPILLKLAGRTPKSRDISSIVDTQAGQLGRAPQGWKLLERWRTSLVHFKRFLANHYGYIIALVTRSRVAAESIPRVAWTQDDCGSSMKGTNWSRRRRLGDETMQ